MRNITGLLQYALGLVALYLVLRHGANASKVIGSLFGGTIRAFKTLQGR